MAIFCSTSWGESTKQKILQRVIQRCSKWWCSKGNGTPAISGKSRLVKYYNLARKMIQFLVLRSEESDLFLFLLYVESWYFKTDCLFLHIFTLYFGRWSNLLLADVFFNVFCCVCFPEIHMYSTLGRIGSSPKYRRLWIWKKLDQITLIHRGTKSSKTLRITGNPPI